jgi:hypothetical protein
MKFFILMLFVYGVLASLADKPDCTGFGELSCMVTLAHCPGGCCNDHVCSWQDGEHIVHCRIGECEDAMSDPCWRHACVDGMFDRQRWDDLQREWGTDKVEKPQFMGLETQSARFETLILKGKREINVADMLQDLEDRVQRMERDACYRRTTSAPDGEVAFVCQ